MTWWGTSSCACRTGASCTLLSLTTTPAAPALACLADKKTIHGGVLRFWKLKSAEEGATEGDKARELWVLRLAHNSMGNKLLGAIRLLDSEAVLDQALGGVTFRKDHCPKGSLQRQLEGLITNSKGGKPGDKDAPNDLGGARIRLPSPRSAYKGKKWEGISALWFWLRKSFLAIPVCDYPI